jgi:predicted  nucleic acid-binding Zn-ribbon protein
MAGKGASAQASQEGEDVTVATSAGSSEEEAAAWATQRERYEDMLADARAEARELQDRLDELEEQSQLEAEQVAAQIRELELAQQQERERRQEAERDYKSHLEVCAGQG